MIRQLFKLNHQRFFFSGQSTSQQAFFSLMLTSSSFFRRYFYVSEHFTDPAIAMLYFYFLSLLIKLSLSPQAWFASCYFSQKASIYRVCFNSSKIKDKFPFNLLIQLFGSFFSCFFSSLLASIPMKNILNTNINIIITSGKISSLQHQLISDQGLAFCSLVITQRQHAFQQTKVIQNYQNKMRNRLQTERSIRTRGNPYYRLPSHHRIRTQASDPLHLTLQSDLSKCTKKYGRSAQPTLDSLSNKYPFELPLRNICAFRQVVVQSQNSSILPFLNSLRHHKSLHNASSLHEVAPFEVSLKPTCNTKVQKRVCDLTKSEKLNDLKFLWREPCSQNRKMTIEYDCMLRQYEGGDKVGPKFSYDPRVRYESTIQPMNYQPSDIVCEKFRRAVKARK